MLIIEDEATTFEVNPLGNRQRLRPRDSFIARNAGYKAPVVIEEPSMVVDDSMMMHETIDEAMSEGMYTMSDMVLPANAVVHAALEDVPALPSLLPAPAALILLPKEIDYRTASPYYPPTESHNALPVASRRFRYLAAPAIALLALVALGGAAALPAAVEAEAAPVAHVEAIELTGTPRVSEHAHEPPAPIEKLEKLEKIERKRISIARPAPRAGKVTVNASTALGNLRPGRAF